ncbi:SDR family NAD(P)-dependent oxidoreductase [Marinivivus vitaminiproducens]|uniref:SDR family NAD(P)-dependent oxidoreductase n=1 Tax=Marinivivus vitaminiproducens TaxID=3035935 RepID=UPI0027A24603|nr:SDR family NAD(P)-dependent oxidoreductase [Geminicoccaceae bacterium SCSIO 64248]
MSRLSGKIALISGASRGVGQAVAVRAAGEGAHVVLVARTTGGLEETDDRIRAAGGQATLVPCDLTQSGMVSRLADALFERFGRLDILIGNAGELGILSPVAHIDTKLWERTFALNVVANQRLIRVFDPLLRASEAGRAVFVTGREADAGKPFWSVYAASKAALEQMVLAYAAEVAHSSLRVNLIRPCPVATALRAKAYPGEDAGKLPKPEAITGAFIDLAAPECSRHGEIVDALPDS